MAARIDFFYFVVINLQHSICLIARKNSLFFHFNFNSFFVTKLKECVRLTKQHFFASSKLFASVFQKKNRWEGSCVLVNQKMSVCFFVACVHVSTCARVGERMYFVLRKKKFFFIVLYHSRNDHYITRRLKQKLVHCVTEGRDRNKTTIIHAHYF